MLKIIGFLCVSVITSPLSAATLTVDLNDGADYADIQSAIGAAAAGDKVLVKPGEYVIAEPINFNRGHDQGIPESPPPKKKHREVQGWAGGDGEHSSDVKRGEAKSKKEFGNLGYLH